MKIGAIYAQAAAAKMLERIDLWTRGIIREDLVIGSDRRNAVAA